MTLNVSSGAPDPLAPGTYSVRVFEPNPSCSVGDGWFASVADTRLVALVWNTETDSDCLCILAPDGIFDPASLEKVPLPSDLTKWLTANPGIITTNPSSVQVGNLAARQMEVTVAEGITLQDGRLPLLSAAEHTYSLAPGEKGHIIVIDHPTGPLVLAIRSPQADYPDYFRQTEIVAGSLTFAD
jgi:hypothetical protein